MSELKTIEKYIMKMSVKYNIPINEISLSHNNDVFISVWRYIEGGVTKNDKWEHLETNKIH